MPKLKVLSGQDVINIFISFGFSIANQKGSHVKLVRNSGEGMRQVLTIPDHHELDKGTLKAIYRQATRFIPESDLHKHIYHN